MTKVLLALAVLSMAGGGSGFAARLGFSGSAPHGNTPSAAAIVYLRDSDSRTAIYSVSSQKPGVVVQKCINVTYTGTPESRIRLYASPVGAAGRHTTLRIESGTSSSTVPACAGFTADPAPPLYHGTLERFADTYGTYATGLADAPDASTTWAANDAVVYRFTLTVHRAIGGAPRANGFTWEARSRKQRQA